MGSETLKAGQLPRKRHTGAWKLDNVSKPQVYAMQKSHFVILLSPFEASYWRRESVKRHSMQTDPSLVSCIMMRKRHSGWYRSWPLSSDVVSYIHAVYDEIVHYRHSSMLIRLSAASLSGVSSLGTVIS